jgi:excisionase family DNA binding protein
VTTLPAEVFDGLVERVADAVAERVVAHLATSVSATAEPWRLLDVQEVAQTLGRSRRWVHQAVKERGLPYIRLDGGALAFELEAVQAWARGRSIPRRTPKNSCTPLADPPISRGNGG